MSKFINLSALLKNNANEDCNLTIINREKIEVVEMRETHPITNKVINEFTMSYDYDVDTTRFVQCVEITMNSSKKLRFDFNHKSEAEEFISALVFE